MRFVVGGVTLIAGVACVLIIAKLAYLPNPGLSPKSDTPPLLETIPDPTPEATPEPTPTPTPTREVLRVDLPGLPEGAQPLELVPIPAGTFLMGSTDAEHGRKFDEGPAHKVTIADDYLMGTAEVTQAQWKAVMKSIPEKLTGSGKGEGDDFPVYYVSWEDAQEFLRTLTEIAAAQGLSASHEFRLPSEPEWERACRGGVETAFFFGDLGEDELDCQQVPAGGLPGKRSDYMWYCWSAAENGFPTGAKEVAALLPNQFGLYDTSGNLFEWCQDWMHSYVNAPDVGTAWEVPATDRRMIRGGCWGNKAKDCRSALRAGLVPDYRGEAVGFRVARTR